MKNIIALLALFYCCSMGFAAGHDALPIPDPDFKGKIGTSYADSQQDFASQGKPGKARGYGCFLGRHLSI